MECMVIVNSVKAVISDECTELDQYNLDITNRM